MFGDLDKYIAVFLTGFVVVYLLTPLVRSLAIRYGVVDVPNERRPHKRPTARGGGAAVVLGVHAACLMALSFPWARMAGDLNLHWWRHFVAGSLILLVVGLLDDVRGMRPLLKLGGQTLAAILMASAGTQFGRFFGMQLPGWLDSILVVVWLLAVINAFNLIDGLDGLASGLACISSVGLCGVFIIQGLPGNVLVLVGLIGACLAFLRYNFHPATIFLGDTGSMFLGFMLGTISLDTCTKDTFLLSMAIPMLVLGIPIYDTMLAIWRRSVRQLWTQNDGNDFTQKQRGIMQPDLDHLHHRLLKTGLSTSRVATLLYAGNAGLVIFGLLVTNFQSHAAGIFLIALLAGVYVLMRHLAIIELRDTGAALLRGLRKPTPVTFKALAYPAWDMTVMAGSVALAKWFLDDYTPSFWHDWFVSLPVWLTPTFGLLAMSRTYITVWSRARMRDIISLFLTLQAGLLLSLGLALLIDPYTGLQRSFLCTVFVVGLGHPAIIALRMVYRIMEEVVSWSRSKDGSNTNGNRVVLYGAGARCWLLIRELGLRNSNDLDGRNIVGMIDDDESLHSQWVYGYLVLGGLKDLPHLIPAHQLDGIVVTAQLAEESRAAVTDLALQHGLELTEWSSSEQILVAGGTAPKNDLILEVKSNS